MTDQKMREHGFETLALHALRLITSASRSAASP